MGLPDIEDQRAAHEAAELENWTIYCVYCHDLLGDYEEWEEDCSLIPGIGWAHNECHGEQENLRVP